MIQDNNFNLLIVGIIAFLLVLLIFILRTKKSPRLAMVIAILFLLSIIVPGIILSFFSRNIYSIEADGNVGQYYLIGSSYTVTQKDGTRVIFTFELYQCLIMNNSNVDYEAVPLVYKSDETNVSLNLKPITVPSKTSVRLEASKIDFMPQEEIPETVWEKQSGSYYKWALKKAPRVRGK